MFPKRQSVCRRHGKQIMHSTEPVNQQFSIPVLVYLHLAFFACLSLLTHQLTSLLEVSSVHELFDMLSVVDKCNLEWISCLKLSHGP